MTRLIRRLTAVLIAAAMVLMMGACSKPAGNAEPEGAAEKSGQEIVRSLMEQVAATDIDNYYEEYLPGVNLADADVFGTEDGLAYAFLYEAGYVVLKDKAYLMVGSAGPVILHYNMEENAPVLTEVEWSADGEMQEQWLEEHFPAEVLEKYRAFIADDSGRERLIESVDKQAAEKLGVPVETENLLMIDTEAQTYEILAVKESGEGENYKFETETIEQGSLADL